MYGAAIHLLVSLAVLPIWALVMLAPSIIRDSVACLRLNGACA